GDPHKVTAALNVGMVFFALGSLVTPTLCDLLLRAFDFQRTLRILAGLCLVPALVVAVQLALGTPFRPEPHAPAFSAVFGDLRVWMAGLVFFLYGPLEFAVGTWTTTYLMEHGYKERRATRLLSGFWLTFLAGRVLLAFLQDRGVLREWSDYFVIPILGLLGAVTLGNLAGAPADRRPGWGLLVLG